MSGSSKKIVIALLLVVITSMHYFVDGSRILTHILHRELYFVPIALTAFWFGKKWGLSVAVLCSILFLPRFLLMEHISDTFNLSNILEIPVYLLVGYLIGHIQDIRNAHWRALTTPLESPATASVQKHRRRVLLCIYNTSNVSKLARFVTATFTKENNLSLNILGFIREPSGNAFNKIEEYQQAKFDNERIVSELVKDAYHSLLEDGFQENAISKTFVRVQKETLAGRIMEEQRQSLYDMVVVPGENMSKTEEFVMGNTAVKLVRELNCPVLTVF